MPKGRIDWDNPTKIKKITGRVDWGSISKKETSQKDISEIKKAPEKNMFGKIENILKRPFMKTPTTKKAEAQNIYALSKVTNLPIEKVRKNYDKLVRQPKATGMQPSGPKDLMELGEPVIAAGIGTGLVTNPAATLGGLGLFMGLSEIENAIVSKLEGEDYKLLGDKRISDLLPEEVNETTKTSVDVLGFLGKGALAGGMLRKTPKLYRKFTKNVIERYNLPKKYYIPAEKVSSIFKTGKKISPRERSLVKDLGLSGEQYRKAVKNGVTIKVPTEKVVTMADKPYWGKIKSMFGLKPFKETKVITPKPKVAPSGLLKGKTVSPPKEIAKPTEIPAAVERVKQSIQYDNPKIKTERNVDKLYRTFIDELNPITKFTKKAKEKGLDISSSENPDLLSHLYSGWEAKASQFIREETFDPKTLKSTGKSFEDILKPISKSNKLDDFSTYLVSRRVPELDDRGIETGINVEDAQKTISALEKENPKFKKKAEEIYDFQKRVLGYAKKNSLFSQDMVDKINDLNRNYIPFHRAIQNIREKQGFGKGFEQKGRVTKRIKGSEKAIVNPLESVIKNTYSIINASEKNAVSLSMANLAQRDKYLEKMFKKVPPKMAKVAKVKPKEIFDKNTLEKIKKGGVKPKEIIDIFRPSMFSPKGNTVTLFRNGKKEYYKTEPTLYRAIKGMDKEETGLLIKILSQPTRWLRAGAIFDPEFSLGKNPLRDQLTAFLYSKYGYKPLYDLTKGISSLLKKDKFYKQWNRAGGPHSTLVSLDRDYLKQTLKETLETNKVKNLVKNPLELLRTISEVVEEATRVGEFRRGVKQGANPLEAAMSSKDVTINFSRKGTLGRTLNRIYAFWNSVVQGENKFYRSLKNNPGRTFWRAFLGITIPSISLYYYNKKHNPRYDEIPQWERDLFWIVPIKVSEETTPSGLINFRLPKPFLPGQLFGTVPIRLLEYFEDQDITSIKKLGDTLSKEAPIPSGGIPTALKPTVENMTNHSFFRDRPIVPYSEQRVEAQFQEVGYTSETAKKLGKLLNYSPIKIDHAIRGHFGGLSEWALRGTDKILKELGLVETKVEPKKYWFEQPGIKAITVSPPVGSSNEKVNRLYRYYKRAIKKEQTFNKLKKKDKKQAINYIKNNPRGLLATYYRGIIRTFGDIRNAIDRIYDTDKLSSKKKRKKIQKLRKIISDTAKEAIKVEDNYDEMREKIKKIKLKNLGIK